MTSPFETKYEASVIIVTYNQQDTLSLALEALLCQDFSNEFEIIVCDDGSSASLFSEMRDRFCEARLPIRYVWQQDQHIRPAQSRNSGIKLAQGRVLIFLDGDMVPALDFVTRHVAAHDQPRMIVAGNRFWKSLPQNSLAASGEQLVNVLKSQVPTDPRLREREQKEQAHRAILDASESRWRVCFTCNVSVERNPEVFFDENMVGWGVEDWEMACRLCNWHGYTPMYISEIAAYQVEAPGIFFNVFRRNKHEEIVAYMRNVIYFVDKFPELDLQPLVTFGFARFRLDSVINKWYVVERRDAALPEDIFRQARDWFQSNSLCSEETPR